MKKVQKGMKKMNIPPRFSFSPYALRGKMGGYVLVDKPLVFL